MPVVLRKFPMGAKHPPNATGFYSSEEKIDRKADLDEFNRVYKTKEAWEKQYYGLNGHTLSSQAWIYLWDDWYEENEFGPVTP